VRKEERLCAIESINRRANVLVQDQELCTNTKTVGFSATVRREKKRNEMIVEFQRKQWWKGRLEFWFHPGWHSM